MARTAPLLTMFSFMLCVSGCTVIPGVPFEPKGGQALPPPAPTTFTEIHQKAEVPAPLPVDEKAEKAAVVPANPPKPAPAVPVVDRQWITVELLSSMIAAPTTPQSNMALEQDLQDYEYHVGRGDILAVSVWGHPEMSTTGVPAAVAPGPQAAAAGAGNSGRASGATGGILVYRDGTIFFPYVGTVKVEGLSLSALRTKLTKLLDKYIPYPQVDVTVQSYESQKVYVTGEVNNAGPLAVTNVPMTLLDAVSRVGGFKPTADLRNVVLIRNRSEVVISLADLLQRGDMSQNLLLKNGDLLYFPTNTDNKVFVLGEVDKRNVLPIGPQGTSLGEALAASGGISVVTAKPTGVFVLRAAPTPLGAAPHIEVFQLDASDPTAYVLADRFPLKPRDFIYVTAAPITIWNRVLGQLLPSLSSALLLNSLSPR